MAKPIELLVDGKHYTVQTDPDEPLLFVLRDHIGLTGTKYGCGEGQCGACTVLIDGTARRSCQFPAGAAAHKSITTVEGLEKDGRLHPVQQAFFEAEAFQCAYCTSGMIMSSVSLLRQNANPSEEEIVRAMQGNICRCGTYPRIISAVQKAARAMREGSR
jgi:aerobic-type carbon monoxide dehydrogenase small subunit (CoxS/CutS family)